MQLTRGRRWLGAEAPRSVSTCTAARGGRAQLIGCSARQTENEMLEQLLQIVGSGEYEDNGNLATIAASWTGDALELRISVDHGNDETSVWLISCDHVLEYRLAESRYQIGLNVWRGDHPALNQYTSAFEGLYISSPANDADRAVGQLWSAHVETVGDWIEFERYLNRELALRTLLSSPSALVAQGPTFLMLVYEAALVSNGCSTSRVPVVRHRREETPELIHFGESYVIAGHIRAERAAV